jgi:hypothetical protein
MIVMRFSKVPNVQHFGEGKFCRNRLPSIRTARITRGCETCDVQLTERGCKDHPDAPALN